MNENRDLIGDQIGYAVDRLLSFTKLSELDARFMRWLPRPLARTIVLFRLDHDLLPEPEFDPNEAYAEFLRNIGRAYLGQFGERHPQINTIIFDDNQQIRAHSKEFVDGTSEVCFHWLRQVEWAKNVISSPQERSTEDLREATGIAEYQKGIYVFYKEYFKPVYTKQGLPYPKIGEISID